MRPSKLKKKYEWLGENPKGRLGRMSVSVRIYFLHWRSDIRRGDIRRKGRSLWSDKEFRWELGLVSLTFYLEFGVITASKFFLTSCGPLSMIGGVSSILGYSRTSKV